MKPRSSNITRPPPSPAARPAMTDRDRASYVGRSLLRREDRRLLTGRGQFIADLALPRMLHAAFVRSPMAHARIRSVDLSRAAAAPGVRYVLSGAELQKASPPVPDTQLSLPSKWKAHVQHKMLGAAAAAARASIRCGMSARRSLSIVAESRYAAEDAAELVDGRSRAAAGGGRCRSGARASEARIVHEQFATNLIGEFVDRQGRRRCRACARSASLRSPFLSITAMPRCRWNAAASSALTIERTDSITIWSSTQVVHWLRREAAACCDLPEARIRCLALDVGGGFGVKGHVYPEDLLIPFLARAMGRPVRWIEDRHEHLHLRLPFARPAPRRRGRLR